MKVLKFKQKLFNLTFTISACLLILACPSEDECTKTITIPQTYFVGNQSYTNNITQEVPCDFPEPTEPEIIEAPVLENFTYQILSFNFIQDTGNNTTVLQYEIQLNNHNDYDVTGFPKLTIYDGVFEISGNFSNNASEPCFEISANSNCVLTYDQESSLDLGLPSPIFEIINVEYIVTN